VHLPLIRRGALRRVSAWRRHRLAGVAVVLVALTAVGGAYATLSPDTAEADNSQSDLVDEGRKLFLVGCSTCHGLNGEGVLAGDDDRNYGPPLVGVGAAAVDFQVGTGRMPMALVGPQAEQKKPVYTDEEIEALAAYVASLGPGPPIPPEEYTDISGVTQEELTEGGQFFRTNCTACHNSVGAGGALPSGRFAPRLDGVEPKHIYEAMVTGPQQMPVFSDAVITPEDKRSIIAYIKAVEAQPDHGGFSLGGFGPVSEGVVVFLVGMAALVAATIWITSHGARVTKNVSKRSSDSEADR
jgi:ubiquinol-cytochrome c reductase cytochrome c subunit